MERVRERLSKATSLRMDSEERKPIRPMPLPKWTPEAVAKTLGERLATKGMKCDLLFRRADVSGTGSLTHSEFRQLLQDMNIVMTDADFATFVHTIDKDDDGDISYGEWIAKYGAIIRGHEYRGLDLPIGEKEYALETKLFSKSSNARKIFRLFDEDKSGTLTYAEYREALEFFNITMTDENFATMMAEIDTNRDMMVSYNEFLAKYGHLIAGHGYTGLDLGHSDKFVPPQTPPPDVGSNRLSVVLKDRLLTRPQMVRTAFLRADHQREGALSEADLRAVFARIGISVHNRTWSDFVDKLPKTEAARPKVATASPRAATRGPADALAEEAAGDADVLDLETGRATGRGVRESFAAFAARQQLDDAPPGAPPSPRRPAPGPASPKRPAQPRSRVKRQSKPSVPKQLRVAKRTHGRKTVASQRHLVATLQRRIDQRLGPQAQPRKAFC
ncbi:serine/threonine kinase [Aureococcus anophagefferens]|nr:serine/threonine kinase [Aureococcus anophagefferens]